MRRVLAKPLWRSTSLALRRTSRLSLTPSCKSFPLAPTPDMDYVNDKEVGTGADLVRIRDQTVDEQAKDPPFDQDMGDATTSEEPLFIDQFYSNLLSISNVDASNDAAVYRTRDIVEDEAAVEGRVLARRKVRKILRTRRYESRDSDIADLVRISVEEYLSKVPEQQSLSLPPQPPPPPPPQQSVTSPPAKASISSSPAKAITIVAQASDVDFVTVSPSKDPAVGRGRRCRNPAHIPPSALPFIMTKKKKPKQTVSRSAAVASPSSSSTQSSITSKHATSKHPTTSAPICCDLEAADEAGSVPPIIPDLQ
ncbi:hypothetical protein Bca52824_047939 [Brassica carinata]|uniref:Uncharacterized protein n=1 Tax=Brassica carinata TaxID=52824 RepID=A0A8X7RHI5_BRACI|nr:hypothetical protein Bca52824_047939 [Brassica carinata]